MSATIILLGVIAFLIIFIILIYNGIISRMNAVERGWANVITQERQKNKIIPHLEQIVEQYKLHESSVLTKITELRSALQEISSNKIDVDSLSKIEHKTTELLRGFNLSVEDYPDLKASETYLKLMKEISEQQENIGAAIRIFNQNVEIFNNGIEIFPNSIVNSLFTKKEKINTFTDLQASGGFDYSPNIS